jgi:hypothetical protein
MNRAGTLIASAIVTFVAAIPAVAQDAAAPPRPLFTPFLENWTRLSAWSFFEPPSNGGDPDYVHVANRLRVGVRRAARRYEVIAAVQYVHLGGLPDRAIGPGPLGDGAMYFDHAGRTNPWDVYLRYLNVRLTAVPGGLIAQGGRMGYTSGAEAPSGVPKVDTVSAQRIGSRLIGEFEWSLFQRSYDGVRVDWKRPRLQATGAWLRPTQGGFEDAANRSIADIDLLIGAVTLQPGTVAPRTQAQLFAYRYDDERPVRARPDNSGLSASRVDASIATFGASLAGAYPAGPGEADTVLWVAGQSGSWYGQRHRAISVAVEGGFEWATAPWRPWVRGGLLYASGDPNPADDQHGTFFPMLPTVRKYALSATYSPMNLNDRFLEISLRPHDRVRASTSVRVLSLVSAADGWYAGSGATQQEGRIFGYAMRPSRGATGLGKVLEGSMDVRLTPHWSLNGYLGHIRGGDVVDGTFARDRLFFGYVEQVLRF